MVCAAGLGRTEGTGLTWMVKGVKGDAQPTAEGMMEKLTGSTVFPEFEKDCAMGLLVPETGGTGRMFPE